MVREATSARWVSTEPRKAERREAPREKKAPRAATRAAVRAALSSPGRASRVKAERRTIAAWGTDVGELE